MDFSLNDLENVGNLRTLEGSKEQIKNRQFNNATGPVMKGSKRANALVGYVHAKDNSKSKIEHNQKEIIKDIDDKVAVVHRSLSLPGKSEVLPTELISTNAESEPDLRQKSKYLTLSNKVSFAIFYFHFKLICHS